MVTGISQQGTSAAVIKALDDVRERGIVTISMTGEYDTEITRHADANIYIECGYEDAGATTKGFTATVLTLMIWIIDTAESIGRITEKEAEANRCCNKEYEKYSADKQTLVLRNIRETKR